MKTKAKILATNRASGKKDNKETEPISYYIGIGDCTVVHIECFRNTLIKKYGKDSCSKIQVKNNEAFFEYETDIDIDWHKELNIAKSVSSVSSTSTSTSTRRLNE